MDTNLNLDITQEQKLVMTQEMRLSLKVLQMSSLELRDYLEKEYQENPVLDLQQEIAESMEKIDAQSFLKSLEPDFRGNREAGDYNKADVTSLDYLSMDETLSDFLLSQISVLDMDDYERALCEFVVDSLDSRGYFTDSEAEVAKILNTSEEDVQRAVRRVQSLEPGGIAARDLKECLLIQLRMKGILTKVHEKLVKEHLDDIAEGRVSSMAKALNMKPLEVQDIIDDIRELEPKPARGFFDGRKPSYIVPDGNVIVENGEISLRMNTEFIPRLQINKVYKTLVSSTEQKETREYLDDMMSKAIFLLKSVDKRKDTLRLVIEAVIKRQKAYFTEGEEFLKPLTMKEVAEELGIHESTVSRAIKEKYIATPKGTIKLKELFKTAVKGTGQEMATDFVIGRIKDMIDGEDPKNPLSDQAIADTLNEEGISIRRRTVAKYRDELGIGSSSRRKRV